MMSVGVSEEWRAIAELDEELKSKTGIDVSGMPISTYDEIKEKVLTIHDAIYAKYIPDICQAVHEERPRLKETGIKNIVAHQLIDVYPGIVNDEYLHAWRIKPKQLFKPRK